MTSFNLVEWNIPTKTINNKHSIRGSQHNLTTLDDVSFSPKEHTNYPEYTVLFSDFKQVWIATEINSGKSQAASDPVTALSLLVRGLSH